MTQLLRNSNFAKLRFGLLASFLMSFSVLFGATSEPAYAESMTIEVSIVGGAVEGESTVRVTQGDAVAIVFRSDTELVLHLHGYDIKTRVKPDGPATMSVDARVGGRFAIETHGHGDKGHQTLLYLEVHPR